MSALPLGLAPLELRRAVWSHLLSSLGEAAARFLLGLVLARLLSPAELGLFALAMAIYGGAHLLRDAGLSAYLQREPSLTPARFAACLGWTCCTTAAATLALLMAARPLAELLGQPPLAPVLWVLAVMLPVSAFGSVVAALQLRTLAATAIARVSLLGLGVQAVVSVLACSHGAGALGLALGQLLGALACGLACVGGRPRLLSWRPRLAGMGEVACGAGAAMLPSVLTHLHAAVPDLLLARVGGVHALGLLGRGQAAVGLLQAVAGRALSFGSLPVLAGCHARAEPLGPLLQRSTAVITGIGWPLLALTARYREPLIHALYGAAWLEAAPAVVPLALVAAVALGGQQIGHGLAAVGRPVLAALPVAVVLLARVGLGAAGVGGGVLSFAWALAAASLLVVPLQLWLGARHLGLPVRAALTAWGVSGVVAAAVVAVPPALALLAWGGALVACRHPLHEEFRQLARRRMTSRK